MSLYPAGEEWKADARCKLPGSPSMYDQTTVYRAIQWCQECPVKAPCLEYALSRGEVHGVWGGTSERERVRLLRRRRVQLQSV